LISSIQSLPLDGCSTWPGKQSLQKSGKERKRHNGAEAAAGVESDDANGPGARPGVTVSSTAKVEYFKYIFSGFTRINCSFAKLIQECSPFSMA
jgi:hypothetical protein